MADTWHNGTPSWHTCEPGLVVASGELDLTVAAQFEAAIVRQGGPDGVRIDLADVTFIDSSGIHALVNARAAVGRVVIRRPSTVVLRLLEVTGTGAMFEIEQDGLARGRDLEVAPPVRARRAPVGPVNARGTLVQRHEV